MKNLLSFAIVAVIAAVLCSCMTVLDAPSEVAELATLLGPHWQGDKTEDAIFLKGTNVLNGLWAVSSTDGYPYEVYRRSEYISRRLDTDNGLRLVHEDQLFAGMLPVSHRELASAVRQVIPLLLQAGDEDQWKVDSSLVSIDGTRAQVRCSATFGPLSGSGWLLVFVNRNEEWTLVLIERTWVS
jgi:hypothetical protein